jgi:hypothetical protein
MQNSAERFDLFRPSPVVAENDYRAPDAQSQGRVRVLRQRDSRSPPLISAIGRKPPISRRNARISSRAETVTVPHAARPANSSAKNLRVIRAVPAFPHREFRRSRSSHADILDAEAGSPRSSGYMRRAKVRRKARRRLPEAFLKRTRSSQKVGEKPTRRIRVRQVSDEEFGVDHLRNRIVSIPLSLYLVALNSLRGVQVACRPCDISFC